MPGGWEPDTGGTEGSSGDANMQPVLKTIASKCKPGKMLALLGWGGLTSTQVHRLMSDEHGQLSKKYFSDICVFKRKKYLPQRSFLFIFLKLVIGGEHILPRKNEAPYFKFLKKLFVCILVFEENGSQSYKLQFL